MYDFGWGNDDLLLQYGIGSDISFSYPIGSMYGIFTYIYRKNQPNVGKYTMRPYGYALFFFSRENFVRLGHG